MTELEKIFLTSGLTIVGGVFVFVIGQFVNELLIKPYIRYKKIIVEIDEELIFFANIYLRIDEFCIKNEKICLKASDRLRRLASQFVAIHNQVKWLIVFKKVLDIQAKDKISDGLMGLSNGVWAKGEIESKLKLREKLRKLLKI